MLKKYLIISSIVLVFIIAVAIRFWSPEDAWLCKNGVWVKHGNPKQGQPSTVCGNLKLDDYIKACTEEAMICPDGSAVGRTGPNCEFTPCPGPENQNSLSPFDSGVAGKVLLGPSCPVMREGDVNCVDKPYSVDIQVIVVGSPKSSPFATIKSDADGKFKLMLPPGEYALQPIINSVFPRCETKSIIIETAKITEADISCDTGIR